MVWLGWDADGNYIWTQRGYMYRESLALLSTQYVGTYLGMMVWLGWDGNDPAAASSLSFPHMPTTLPIYRQVTLQKHTIMKYGVQISEFRIREIPLAIYRRLVSLQNTESTKNVLFTLNMKYGLHKHRNPASIEEECHADNLEI